MDAGQTVVGCDMSVEQNGSANRRRVRPLAAALLTAVGLLATATPVAAHVADPTRADGRPGVAADRPAASIPPGAFLQPEDLGGAATAPADAELRPYLRPPQPCAAPGGYPAVGSRRASGAVSALYPVAETRPTVLLEDLGVYQNDGAHRYLRQLRRAVAGAGGCTDATGRWTVLAYDVAGRDSVLLRLREQVEDYDGNLVTRSTYLFVARVGAAVVTLADLGWELGDGHESVVRDLAPAAVRRAGTLG